MLEVIIERDKSYTIGVENPSGTFRKVFGVRRIFYDPKANEYTYELWLNGEQKTLQSGSRVYLEVHDA
jgi:hypothetical protein